MALANTTDTYGDVSKVFHWLTALLILTAIPLGVVANGLPYDTGDALAQKAFVFSLHKTVGIAAFFVALARILWAVTQPKPRLLHPDRRIETSLAETVHWLLYVSLVLVPLTGWIHHAATTGFAPIWWPFGQSLPFVPKDEAVAGVFAGFHFVITKVLALAIVLHIAGALKHHFIDKDATLKRMLFGNPALEQAPASDHKRSPAFVAVAIYVVAMIGGGILGTQHSGAAVPPAAELAAVESDWTVQDGSLGITVTQFGSTVEGEFADWTASIAFSETPVDGRHGSVEVTIAIASLTLGSVTDQALGAAFFNAAGFPTATYTADILAADEGYIADGVLTLKGAEVPVAFPFSLEIEGDTATMSGTTSLDRRAFNIGEGYDDEATVSFPVEVNISLTATRSET